MRHLLRSGARVRVTGRTSEWRGERGEILKTDLADPVMTYKVVLDNGMPLWLGPDELARDLDPDYDRQCNDREGGGNRCHLPAGHECLHWHPDAGRPEPTEEEM